VRRDWEAAYAATYIAPLLAELDVHLEANRRHIMEDVNRLG